MGGDAIVRKGLRGHLWAYVLLGSVMLGAYGIVVNLVKVGLLQTARCLLVCVCHGQRVVRPLFLWRECRPPPTRVGVFILASRRDGYPVRLALSRAIWSLGRATTAGMGYVCSISRVPQTQTQPTSGSHARRNPDVSVRRLGRSLQRHARRQDEFASTIPPAQ